MCGNNLKNAHHPVRLGMLFGRKLNAGPGSRAGP
jgi:hypothetical protein